MQISSTNNINKIIDNTHVQQAKKTQVDTANGRVTSGSEKISGSLWRAMTQKIDPYGARAYLFKQGLMIGLSPADVKNLVTVMEKGSVETSNIEMLLNLVKEGDLSKRTIRYVCAEGMMSESMEKDIDMIYEAKADGVDVNERYVPHRANKEEALANSSVGDVFAVDGEENVFIKNKDGEAEQLKMNRDMYLSLFPAAERFASAQNKAGDCYYLSAINAMMDNPNSRAKVLQCFEQNGNSVKIKFPNSDYEYVAENAELKNTAERSKLLVGATGLQLLEHSFGYMEEDRAINQYYEGYNKAMSSLNEQLASATDKNVKEDLERTISGYQTANKTFEEDRASRNPKMVFDRDEEHNIVTDKNGVGIFRNVDNIGKTTGMYYKSTADYYRSEGGFLDTVFENFGYNVDYSNDCDEEAKKMIGHFDDADSYLILGGTRAGKTPIERKLNRSMSMYTGHAYRIIPFRDNDGNEKFRVSNPWNGSHDAVMTFDDMSKYFTQFSCVKVK